MSLYLATEQRKVKEVERAVASQHAALFDCRCGMSKLNALL